MATMQKIQALGRQLGREFPPEGVVLFGSHARGDAGPDLDVDRQVVMPCEGKPVYQAAKIRASLYTDFPVDILVRTPDRARELQERGDSFTLGIMEQDKVLYEAVE